MIEELYCRRCNEKLSKQPLYQADVSQLREFPQRELLQDDQYVLVSDYGSGFALPLTHLVSTVCLAFKNHPDEMRFLGCCGSGQLEQYNQVCINCSYSLGLRYDDCIGSSFTAVNMDRLSLIPVW